MRLTLAEACATIVDCEHKTAPIDGNGRYFAVGTPAMRDNSIDYSQARRISEETFKLWTRRLSPQRGDLLFAREAPVGPIVMIPEEGNIAPGQRTVLLRPNPDLADTEFVFYLLSSPIQQQRIQSLAAGSTVAHLNVSDIRSFEIELPSLEKQRAIAEVLSALDDKIAANTKLAQISIELARLEFQQLLTTPSTKLALRDVLRLEYGKPLAAPNRVDGDVDVFGSGGIVGTHNESLMPGPGVVIGRKGTAGAVHWAPRAYFPIDTTYYVVPVIQDASMVFCLHLLQSLRLNEMNSDSAVPGLNREEALSTPVRIPAGPDIQRFTAFAERLFLLVDQVGCESETLTKIRDALLPQLISGKLRVKDAEEIVAAAI